MPSFHSANEQAKKLQNHLVTGLKWATPPHPDAHVVNEDKKFKPYDVDADNRGILTCECKDDKESRKTGNFCIEFGQYLYNGDYEPSGILSTESRFWCHCNGIEYDDAIIYLAYSSVIREFVLIAKKFKDGLIKAGSGLEYKEAEEKRNTYLQEAKEKYGEEKYNDLINTNFLYKQPVEQGEGQPYKDMDLCLIPNNVFPKYCFEVGHKDKITYKDIHD